MDFDNSSWRNYIPEDIAEKYEIYDFRHAAVILYTEFHEQYEEIINALRQFYITEEDIIARGGNESQIPKKFSEVLRPLGWEEKQLHAKLIVNEREISNDTHKVDYIKGRIAFDLEWNSKDQTYDRDLYAFRSFFDYDEISLAILVTRSTDLDSYFESLGTYVDGNDKVRKYKDKYGASTTQLGKLLPRIKSGRNGGCPILIFGITKNVIRTK